MACTEWIICILQKWCMGTENHPSSRKCYRLIQLGMAPMPTALLIASLVLVVFVPNAAAQRTAPTTGADVLEDVIDHRRFDSLWRASRQHGRLDGRAVLTDVYREYRMALASALPDRFLPEARLAFWINAYLALLMEVVHHRVGYRSTVWDSSFREHDTAIIAGSAFTLRAIADTVIALSGSVAYRAFLCTGSTSDPPFPSHAMYARTIRQELRNQLRRLVRSEQFVLYDPAGNVLQLASMFKPWLQAMETEKGSVVSFLLPWLDESTAAQLALHSSSLRVQIADRIERWRKAR